MYRFIAALIAVQVLTACGGGSSRTNIAPQISVVPDATIQANEQSASINITVTDRRVNLVTLTSSSGNPTIVPDAGLSLSGGSGNFTLNITPAPDSLGAAVITLSAADAAGLTTEIQFTVDVVQQQVVIQQYARNAFAVAPTGVPLDVNSRLFEDDVASDNFSDLLN